MSIAPAEPENIAGAQAGQRIAQPFLVLCGCPRSGTYLLADHIERALGVAIPIETHFIPHFQTYLWLWGDLRNPTRMEKLRAAIEAYSLIWVYRGIRSRAPERQATISILPAIGALSTIPGSYPDLLQQIYSDMALQRGRDRFGDKSASFEPARLDLYDRSLNDMRVVHIIRDGRDVWLSWKKHWFGPANPVNAADIWVRHIEQHRAWGARNPGRYLEIRYEDFIRQPDDALRSIRHFLALERDGTIARDEPSAAVGQVLEGETTHRKLGEAIDASNAGQWQRHLDPTATFAFQRIAGKTLIDCGYAPSTASSGGRPPLSTRLSDQWSRMRAVMSTTYAMRRMRERLPIALRLLQILGVDVVAVARKIAKAPRAPAMDRAE